MASGHDLKTRYLLTSGTAMRTGARLASGSAVKNGNGMASGDPLRNGRYMASGFAVRNEKNVASEVALGITERQFMEQVKELAALCQMRWYHTHDSRRSDPGFPDVVMVRGERLIFAELKAEKGRVSAAQTFWLDALRATGAEVYVWRPSDWETIVVTLALG